MAELAVRLKQRPFKTATLSSSWLLEVVARSRNFPQALMPFPFKTKGLFRSLQSHALPKQAHLGTCSDIPKLQPRFDCWRSLNGRGLQLEGWSKAQPPPKTHDQCHGFRSGPRGGAEQDRRGRAFGQAAGFSYDGNAFVGAVGAGGQISDGEPSGGRGQHGARRGHSIEQPQYFKLRLEFVGHAVDHQVGLAHSVFAGGAEGERS